MSFDLSTLAGDLQSPQVVVTAPDGSSLWIDVSSSLASASAPGPSLWPAGFAVAFRGGPPPATDPKATTNPAAFISGQLPTLLGAPGPLGAAWGLWLLAIAAGTAYALIKLHKAIK